jgi:predicted PurR-regulated permease PerM
MIGPLPRRARDSAKESAKRAEAAATRAVAAGRVTSGDGGPTAPATRHSPFQIGFVGALGALLAIFLAQQLQAVSSTIVLVVVSAFLAVGLNPLVEFFIRRGLRRTWAVVVVIALVVAVLTLFVVAIVPVLSEQATKIAESAPAWLDQLLHNREIQRLDNQYSIIWKSRDYLNKSGGKLVSAAFGGAVGIGIAVLSALVNAFVLVVLTIYFLSSLPKTKRALYRLAPASRRPRVESLGDEILGNVGAYVSGAFLVAVAAGLSSLVFLFVIGLGQYAVALAFVVALLDVIPMIGATLGAVVVVAIGFATDPKIGLACLIFYVIYQQVENYFIYPRVMSRSVDIPGAVIVIAALVGAGLLGVVGALLAIPTAAAILLLTREVFIKRQDAR